ncbi:cyclin-dependent kinase 2-interacting protein [Roseibium sp. TrichSKD4]|nr:cyclin-dependent kinase 2-interacting protein [Roseibium sp. TrichSKD4]
MIMKADFVCDLKQSTSPAEFGKLRHAHFWPTAVRFSLWLYFL